jgi:hypothetical protein
MKKNRKNTNIKKAHKSFGRLVLFSFFMAATASGFAFGAVVVQRVLTVDLSTFSHDEPLSIALADLSSMGFLQNSAPRPLKGRVLSVNEGFISLEVFPAVPSEPEKAYKIAVLADENTKVSIRRDKSDEEIASSLAAWGGVLAGLEGKILKAKADLAACVSGDDCLVIGESMDDLIKERGVIESQYLSPYFLDRGFLSDLTAGDEVLAWLLDDLAVYPQFVAGGIEIVKTIEGVSSL